jgi:hypothetical protein
MTALLIYCALGAGFYGLVHWWTFYYEKDNRDVPGKEMLGTLIKLHPVLCFSLIMFGWLPILFSGIFKRD